MTDLGTAYATIESSIHECDSHLAKIERDRGLLEPVFPLSESSFTTLNEEQIEHIDQLIYRFTKLQDSMGTRLLPSMYTLLENNIDPKPFLVILNRLEQLKVLTSVDEWQFFRNLRNNLAHDYPESIGQTVDTLNTLYSELDTLQRMYVTVRQYRERTIDR